MNIRTTVQLAETDKFGLTAKEAADAILKALGGKEKTDSCDVTVTEIALGHAGVEPPAPIGPPMPGGMPPPPPAGGPIA